MKERYPGIKPFSTDQQQQFFGRRKEIDELYRLIRFEDQVVLFGKSGLGKSSLLNAGVLPRIRQSGLFFPVRIRFNAWMEEAGQSPIEIATQIVSNLPVKSTGKANFLDQLDLAESPLWLALKRLQINESLNSFILIFDQFEELFSYPDSDIAAFKESLADLFSSSIPEAYQQRLESLESEGSAGWTDEEEELLEKPLNIKILIAIRSDRLHLLDQLSSHLPRILSTNYELLALSPTDARQALIGPASLEGAFAAEPFQYEPAAVETVIDYLQDRENRIEAIQLQLLCQAFEKKARDGNLQVLDTETIGNLDEIIANYYQDKIGTIHHEVDRLAARKLIEEGLVLDSEESQLRLSMHEGQIQGFFGVDRDLLQHLVNNHLLRAEPSPRGGYTYELCHDTLIAPVLEAKHLRISEEKLAREQQERARREKAESEHRKREAERRKLEAESKLRKRNARIALAGILLSLLAVTGFFIAYYQYKRAVDQAEIAGNERIRAVESAQSAEEARLRAETAKALADSLLEINVALRRDAEEGQAAAETASVLARRQANAMRLLAAQRQEDATNLRQLAVELEEQNGKVNSLNGQLQEQNTEIARQRDILKIAEDSLQESNRELRFAIKAQEAERLAKERAERQLAAETARKQADLNLLDSLIQRDQKGFFSIFKVNRVYNNLIRKGDIHVQSEDYESAIEEYSEAIGKRKTKTLGYIKRASAFISLGRESEAQKDVDRVIALGAARNKQESSLARYQAQLRRQKLAITPENLAESIKLYQNSVGDTKRAAANNVAYIKAKLGEDLEEALEQANYALERDSTEALFFDTRAYVHLRMGNLSSAMEDIRMAMSLDPTDGTFLVTEGLIFLEEGDKARFYENLELSLIAKQPYLLHLEMPDEKLFAPVLTERRFLDLLTRSIELANR